MIILTHLLFIYHTRHWHHCGALSILSSYLIMSSSVPLSPRPSLLHQQSTRHVSPRPSSEPAAPRLAAEGRARAILVCDNIQALGSLNPSEAQNSGTSLVLLSEDNSGKLGSGLSIADS